MAGGLGNGCGLAAGVVVACPDEGRVAVMVRVGVIVVVAVTVGVTVTIGVPGVPRTVGA